MKKPMTKRTEKRFNNLIVALFNASVAIEEELVKFTQLGMRHVAKTLKHILARCEKSRTALLKASTPEKLPDAANILPEAGDLLAEHIDALNILGWDTKKLYKAVKTIDLLFDSIGPVVEAWSNDLTKTRGKAKVSPKVLAEVVTEEQFADNADLND